MRPAAKAGFTLLAEAASPYMRPVLYLATLRNTATRDSIKVDVLHS